MSKTTNSRERVENLTLLKLRMIELSRQYPELGELLRRVLTYHGWTDIKFSMWMTIANKFVDAGVDIDEYTGALNELMDSWRDEAGVHA